MGLFAMSEANKIRSTITFVLGLSAALIRNEMQVLELHIRDASIVSDVPALPSIPIEPSLSTELAIEPSFSDETINFLFSCEMSEQATKQPPTINFMAAASGTIYEDLLPLYAFYALTAHETAEDVVAAEFIVPSRMKFLERHFPALTWLQETFSKNGTDAVCVREYSGNHKERTEYSNTWRFLEVPARQSAKYTYIGDIDVFLTESVFYGGKRLAQMKDFNVPYSDIVRDYSAEKRRLTGVIMMDTKSFYTKELVDAQTSVNAKGNDEVFLYNIVEKAGLGIPPENSTSPLLKFRPTHGVHLSYNRGPWKRMCTTPLKTFNKMLQVNRLEEYRQHDHAGDRYLSVQQTIVEIQDRGRMKIIDRKCQPTNHTI